MWQKYGRGGGGDALCNTALTMQSVLRLFLLNRLIPSPDVVGQGSFELHR